MKVKSSKEGSTFSSIALFFKQIFDLRASIILLLLTLSIILTSIIIVETKSSYYAYNKGKIALVNSFPILTNYLSSYLSSPDHIDLSIKDKNLKRLNYIKELSRENYIGLDNIDPISLMRKEWVPAKLTYNNTEYKVNVRVKGQSVDHWGQYGSFKIKVKQGETILGMKRFALQHPKTRAFLNEWYFHQLLKYNDLIHLRYKFINFSINGDKKPIYALEENFGKRLLENNHRKEGLIFRLSYNQNQRVQIQQSDAEIRGIVFLEEGIELLQTNVNSFFSGNLSLEEVFDIKSLARFYAIIDLFGNRHAGQLKNMRFYFNPITSLIEPIGYDQQAVYPTQFLNLLGDKKIINSNISERSNFFDLIFNNKEFYAQYISELTRISEKEYLDNFFVSLADQEKENLKIIYRSYPYYEYKSQYPAIFWFHQDGDHTRYLNSIWLPKDKLALYNNQDYIKTRLALSPGSASIIIDEVDKETGTIYLKIFNSEYLPLEVKSISLNGKIIVTEIDEVIQAKNLKDRYEHTQLVLNVPKEEMIDENFPLKPSFDLAILGSNNSLTFQSSFQPNLSEENPLLSFSDLSNLSFIEIDNENKRISIKRGQHTIDQSLIIPSGYIFEIYDRTSIDLINSSHLVSYSPISFIGSEDEPIVISSSDKTSGITIINAGEESNIDYVQFSDLSDIAQKGINLSGGINFYQSDIKISNSTFSSIDAEDSINIVRSNFLINSSYFLDSISDAVDTDFSNGKLSNLSFSNIGNDGIDISGGQVNIDNVKVNNVGDKGISIGENSSVIINHLQIKNSNIGIAVKDKSFAYIDPVSISNLPHDNETLNKGIFISNTKIGFAVYQKKSEFGPAELHIGNKNEVYTDLILDKVDDHFLLEEKSFLEVGASEITDFRKNVYESFILNN